MVNKDNTRISPAVIAADAARGHLKKTTDESIMHPLLNERVVLRAPVMPVYPIWEDRHDGKPMTLRWMREPAMAVAKRWFKPAGQAHRAFYLSGRIQRVSAGPDHTTQITVNLDKDSRAFVREHRLNTLNGLSLDAQKRKLANWGAENGKTAGLDFKTVALLSEEPDAPVGWRLITVPEEPHFVPRKLEDQPAKKDKHFTGEKEPSKGYILMTAMAASIGAVAGLTVAVATRGLKR